MVGLRKRERERRPARLRAHRGEVAEVHGQRAVAEQRGRDAVREMHARDQRVDGDGHEAVHGEHRGVVADADQDIRVAARPREIALDDLELADHAFASAALGSRCISRAVRSSNAFTNL